MYSLKPIIERQVSLEEAEESINQWFEVNNTSYQVDTFGNNIALSIVTILDENNQSCVGCGKGNIKESVIGAKYEAYEHFMALKYLRELSDIYDSQRIINQSIFNNFLPLKILNSKKNSKISALYFSHDHINKKDLFFPSFLIDYKYSNNPKIKDDSDYASARRYSCGTGLAVGYNYEEAAIHAVSEVIERHCIGRFLAEKFFHKINSQINIINNDSLSQELKETISAAQKYIKDDILLIDVSIEGLLPVFIACTKNKRISNINLLGGGCSFYPSYAAKRAITELVQQHLVNDNVKSVKDDWQSHYNHLIKYPKLLRCLAADMDQVEYSFINLQKDPHILDLPIHLDHIRNKCVYLNLPVWVKELKKEFNGISTVCAVMPNMERFSIVSLGGYVVPTNKY